MLETLDLAVKVDRDAYRGIFPGLQERLRGLQYELQRAQIPTLVVFEGVDTAGKGTTIAHLVERLDPRLYRVWPARPPSTEERARHFLWRYQMRLPADGRMGIFDRSWYGKVLVDRVEGRTDEAAVRRIFDEVRDFERWLADDGQVIVKFWLHITKKEQKRRMKRLEADPLTAWKVSKEDRDHHRQYADWIRAAEQMFTETDTPYAPWTLVSARDGRHARVEVLRTLVRRMEEALERRLRAPRAVSRTAAAEELGKEDRRRRAAEGSDMARTEAAAAGLPLEEAPVPARKPSRRRSGGKSRRPAASRPASRRKSHARTG